VNENKKVLLMMNTDENESFKFEEDFFGIFQVSCRNIFIFVNDCGAN